MLHNLFISILPYLTLIKEVDFHSENEQILHLIHIHANLMQISHSVSQVDLVVFHPINY